MLFKICFLDFTERSKCVVELVGIKNPHVSTGKKKEKAPSYSSTQITGSNQSTMKLIVDSSSDDTEMEEKPRLHRLRKRTARTSVAQSQGTVASKSAIQPGLLMVKVEEKRHHPTGHKRQKINNNVSALPSDSRPPIDDLQQSTVRVQSALVHASLCLVENCTFTLCEKMKKVGHHVRLCQLRKECFLYSQFTFFLHRLFQFAKLIVIYFKHAVQNVVVLI